MHNMIVEDERDDIIYDQGFQLQGEIVGHEHQEPAMFKQFTKFQHEMRDWQTYMQLQNDLVEHMTRLGNQ